MLYTLIFARVDRTNLDGKEASIHFIPQNLQQEKFGVSAMSSGFKFKMMPVEDFCEILDTEKLKQTNLLSMFKEKGDIHTFCKKYEDLSYNMKQEYLELKKKYLDF